MSILDLIFPKNCLSCKKGGSYICDNCLIKVGKAKQICPVCGKPSIDGFTHIKCRTKYGIDGLVSIWNYEGIIRLAIIALKYKYITEIVESLNSHIVSELRSGNILVPRDYCLVPIPLHWYRENTRGFNQACELGKLVAQVMEWRFVQNLLTRKKLNTPQAQLSGHDRKKNIKGVFSINNQYSDHATYPNNIILFDDVYTTGSTLKEATRELKRKGFDKVWGLTITR
jgi:competence protein ComFC